MNAVLEAARGVPLKLHDSPDYVSDVIRSSGDFYESVVLDEIRRRVAGGVIVDAGAMVGNHTAYLAEFVAHTAIHAFEPWPANLQLLRANVERYPGVTVHPVALSDAEGWVAMSAPAGNQGHAAIGTGDVLVPTVTLDSLYLRDVALIKIDVEGHEPQVLAGARATIARWHPLIVIEDWQRAYGRLLPGYRIAAEWEQAHQTFLYEWVG